MEAYGTTTTNIFRMGIWENGIYKEVHPCFLYESSITLGLFFLLWFLQNKRKFKGEITYIYLIVYSITRFFIESQRTDSLMIGSYKISQVISSVIFVVSLILMMKNVILQNKMSQNDAK